MAKYKCATTGKEIDSYDYNRLSSSERSKYREIDDSGDFIMSAAIGAVTDNAIIGGLLGGSMLGGLIGDIMSDGDLF